MSKYLDIPSGDYTVKVQQGGTITLDAPFRPFSLDGSGNPVPEKYGKVIVTGDLEVQGDTISVSTTNVSLEDNIIELNVAKDSNGNLITLVPEDIVSGVEVNRGNSANPAQWVYDGSSWYYDPNIIGDNRGLWSARVNGTNTVLGIETVSIATPDGVNLNLIGSVSDGFGGSKANTGVVTVAGTVDYETRVTNDDDIPNKLYVDQAIQAQVSTTLQSRIQEGTFGAAETFVETQDDTVSGTSQVIVAIDGVTTASFLNTTASIFDVNFSGNTIRSEQIGQTLVLSTQEFSGIELDDSVLFTPTSSHAPAGNPGFIPVIDPGEPSEGTKLYSKIEGPGGTGLFFVNQEVVETIDGVPTVTKPSSRDEIISKNKAILYSMIF